MIDAAINNWMLLVCAYTLFGCIAIEVVGRYYQAASGTYRVRWRFLFAWPLLVLLVTIYIVACILNFFMDGNNK